MAESWKEACWLAERELEEYKNTIVPALMDKVRNLECRWMPVNVRRPQEFVSVLLYAPGMAPLPTVHCGYLARGCWVIPGIQILEGHEVTHWMEMPVGPGKGDGRR